MKLSQYSPLTFDRVSTREELFQVLELLGGFEEHQLIELAQSSELLSSSEGDPGSPLEFLDEMSDSEEQLLREIDPFVRAQKAERIN